MFSVEGFRAKACPGLDPGWIRVRVKKTRQNKNPEPRSDSIGTEKALADQISALRAGRKRCRIEFVDVSEQFAKCARAVVEQQAALFRRGLRGIAGGAAGVKILGLPGERRRPVRGQPAIILLHRN